jgi:NAD(P)H dehydrogenase (quinone)
MNVLFVYAHEDPASFGAAMHNRALSFFERQKHTTVVSDLYGSGFHAVAAKWDFKVSGGAHQNYMLEQKRAAAAEDVSAFAEDIKTEIAKIRAADLIIVEFPLWWSAPPAMLKGWFDKVFAMGVAWDGDHRYKNGLLGGKKVLVVVGAGDSESYYTAEGLHGASITQHLYPLLHSTLAHAGLDVVKPFIAAGLTTASDEDRQSYLLGLEKHLEMTVKSPEYIYKHSV